MAALAHPRLRSFFACGDFNQRLTTWGARSADEMKWVFADFDIKEITVSYRQSKQLNDLARAMIRAVGGTEQNVSLPAHVDSGGVAPALLEQATDTAIVVSWLADRIREIERFVGQLPSTAIFVNAEDDVAPVGFRYWWRNTEPNRSPPSEPDSNALPLRARFRLFVRLLDQRVSPASLKASSMSACEMR